jgi:hypothetical protein
MGIRRGTKNGFVLPFDAFLAMLIDDPIVPLASALPENELQTTLSLGVLICTNGTVAIESRKNRVVFVGVPFQNGQKEQEHPDF